jgi:hypothetical protein
MMSVQEMQTQQTQNAVSVREAVGVFADDEHLQAAIDELEMEEFARQDISVLGSKMEMERTYDKANRNPYNLEDDPRAPRGVHVMPEEQSLAEASLVGAGIIFTVVFFGPVMGANGALSAGMGVLLLLAAIGGVVGYGLARALRSYRQRHYKKQLRKGGLLLWVNTPTRALERKAQQILAKHGARDVHINEVNRAVA